VPKGNTPIPAPGKEDHARNGAFLSEHCVVIYRGGWKQLNNIQLIIGSVDGAAEFAGITLEKLLTSHGYQVKTTSKPSLDQLLDFEDQLLLILTSTTGNGALPGNLRSMWRRIQTKKPELKGLRYATAVLGDRSYGDDFCRGGLQLDAQLEQLGAERIEQPLLVDAEETNYPEEPVSAWGVLLANKVRSKEIMAL